MRNVAKGSAFLVKVEKQAAIQPPSYMAEGRGTNSKTCERVFREEYSRLALAWFGHATVKKLLGPTRNS